MVAFLPSVSESRSGTKLLPPAKTITKSNQNDAQLVLGSKMTRMTKAKKAPRKVAKAKVKGKAKSKAKAK